MSYKFIKTINPDNEFDIAEITFEIDDDPSLQDILSEMECFLKACGFSFDGSLDIVEEE